jgi:CBS domain-containing protein
MTRMVRDVMTSGVVTCTPETPLHDVASLAVGRHVSAVSVVDDSGRLQGIVSLTDLVRASLRPTDDMTAESVMTSRVATAVPDIPLDAACQIMLDRGVHQLIILEAPTSLCPVGVLSMEDVVRDLARSSMTKGDH